MTGDPFGWIVEEARPRVLLALSALLLGLSFALWSLGQTLVTPEARHGIVSFELARRADRSAAIMASWSPEAREVAMLIQGIDSLYLLVYPAWLSLAAIRLGAKLPGRWPGAAALASWLALAAAPLDAAENHALIQQLLHGPSGLHAALAFWCAVPKFAVVAVAAAFLLAAASATQLARWRRA